MAHAACISYVQDSPSRSSGRGATDEAQAEILLLLFAGITTYSAVVCETVTGNVVHAGCDFCCAFACFSHGGERYLVEKQ